MREEGRGGERKRGREVREGGERGRRGRKTYVRSLVTMSTIILCPS